MVRSINTPSAAEKADDISLQQDTKSAGRSFYRGDSSNFWPRSADFSRPGFLQKFLLKGWLPEGRPLTKGDQITAFGSCFAWHITNYLAAAGYDLSRNRDHGIYIAEMGEGLVNVYALLQQFEWALQNVAPPQGLWHGFKAEEFGYDEDIRRRTRDIFLTTDFFIITLGLSEVWCDEQTDGVFWRAVPQRHFDPSRHKFRVCSSAETLACIEKIYALIRKHVPDARVLFTLSPIPLKATFRNAGCLPANTISKAILRAALDEFMRAHETDLNRRLFYWPSYEIVTELFASPFEPDHRHLRPPLQDFIMALFETAYCETGADWGAMEAQYQQLRAENDSLVLLNDDSRLVATTGFALHYCLGHTVDFTQAWPAALLLGEGWYARESWGIWSSALAELRFSTAPPQADAMVLRLNLTPFGTPNLTLAINGHPVFCDRLPESGDYEVEFPVSLIESGEIRISFTVDGAASPESLGLSDDTRVLGVGLIRLCLDAR